MMMIFNAVGLVISSGSFLYTFHVLYNFMHFTSNHNEKYKAMLDEITGKIHDDISVIYSEEKNSPNCIIK